METATEDGSFDKQVISKKGFKKLIRILPVIKEEIPAAELFTNSHDYEDDYQFSWYDDYACENGCCACCGCSCGDYWDDEDH